MVVCRGKCCESCTVLCSRLRGINSLLHIVYASNKHFELRMDHCSSRCVFILCSLNIVNRPYEIHDFPLTLFTLENRSTIEVSVFQRNDRVLLVNGSVAKVDTRISPKRIK